jgi:transketolase
MKLDNIVVDNLKMGKANLEVFSETLQNLAAIDKDILAVTSDSRGSGKLVPFGKRFPEQIVEMGIAEQNLVGVSAGLASAGKKTFTVSPACFLTARAIEQIKNDVAYSDNPVKLIGISAGVSYGALGSTHHSLHDFAVLRAIHNLIVVAPADNYETRMAIELASKTPHPVYIRFGKKAMPIIHEKEVHFEFGKSIQIREGNDVALIATGECVAPALEAANRLKYDYGVQSRIISMHTIKPLDNDAVIKAALECKAVITIEEHSVNGGLGEACAALILEKNINVKFRRIGIPDEYTVTGSQIEIFNHYGISGEGINKEVTLLLGIKK